MKKRIVIITDCTDIAYNELRGVILDNVKSEEIIIEPVVPVAPFSIINGNFVLRLMAENYPEGTFFSTTLTNSYDTAHLANEDFRRENNLSLFIHNAYALLLK